MKKHLLSVTLFLAALSAQAQNIQSNGFKINPLSALARTGNISYERAVGSSQSIQVGAFYSAVGLGEFKYNGYGITPEFRFYFGGEMEAMNGGYVAPYGRYQNFSIVNKEDNSKASFYTYGGGLTLGFERSFKSGFLLDIFAGPSYNVARFKAGEEDDFDIKGGIKGFGLRTGVAIGFTF